jgi:DNA processing protein
MPSDSYDAFRVSLLPDIGGSRGRALLQRFHHFEGLLRARPRDIARIDGFSETLASRLCAALTDRGLLDRIEADVLRERADALSTGISYVPFDDPAFPPALARSFDPPLYINIAGDLRAGDCAGIALVGTRAPSDYGLRVARTLAADLAAGGVTVVSGLALGIDGEAHRAALQAGGRTVAVLGSGLLRVYPAAHRGLARDIAQNGCLLSELPLHAAPDAVNFPRRNRLISALSRGVVLVESAERGGGMITARMALDQNREVFAVPGSIFSERSNGPNILLRRHLAHACLSVADIYTEIPGIARSAGVPVQPAPPPRQLTLDEEAVLAALGSDPVHIDEIALRCGAPVADLLVTLLNLEFCDLVRQLPGKHFTSM